MSSEIKLRLIAEEAFIKLQKMLDDGIVITGDRKDSFRAISQRQSFVKLFFILKAKMTI